MGFIREYGIIFGAIAMLSVAGYIWQQRGKLDTASVIANTAATVEPIRDHENEIKANPMLAPALIKRLQRGSY